MLLDNIWRAPGPCNFFHMTEHTQMPGCAIIIFLLGTWSLLDPLTRVYLGYLSARQRYLLRLIFFLLSNIFTPGGKSPSVWVGAPVDLAWCIRALDPGLQFLQNSFICKTRLNRTLWPQRSIGMTPSTRPTSWYKTTDHLKFYFNLISTIQSGSHYLADLNNERESKNETYKEVLAGLDNLVLVMWDDDTTIIPKVVALQIKIIHTLLILKSIRRSRHILVSMPWIRTQR